MLKRVQVKVRKLTRVRFLSTGPYLLCLLRPYAPNLLSRRVLSSKEERSGSQGGRGP
jgi:hypothetical protein